jgi:hypothetical protein
MAWAIHQSKQGNNWGLRDEGRKKVGDESLSRHREEERDTGFERRTWGPCECPVLSLAFTLRTAGDS